MKAKKTAPPRPRVSFAVDREEFEISSDWVDAVMTPQQPPAPVVPFPTSSTPPPFFSPEPNNSTDADRATGAECTSVENTAAVDNQAPVEETAAVEDPSPVEYQATVAVSDAVPSLSPNESAVNNTTVEKATTDAILSTGALSASTKDHRIARPRPIIRITDGLTPGQYAVYSLMYQAGEDAGGNARIYRGGYADLGRLTGLSKRGIQNIIAELQAKQVIRIHQQPGYHRTQTSAYFVPNAESVLQIWYSHGWRHAMGKSKTLST